MSTSLNLFLAAMPLLFLVVAMGHPRGLSGAVALPLSAVLALLASTIHFELPLNLASASALTGILSALTPLSIVFGAMLLFAVLKTTGALDVVTEWIASITTHPIAQLMLIGWAFPFLIEGISGFGTPAALAAPLLVGLGFAPLKACFMTLIANTVPVTFGAMGTPVWFGLGELNLSTKELMTLSSDLGSIQLLCALFVPFLALCQVRPIREVMRNWRFILASTASCSVPFWFSAQLSYEFPSVIGGSLGFLTTLGLAHKKWGLTSTHEHIPEGFRTEDPKKDLSETSPRLSNVVLASTPIWASILLLLVTRIEPLGIKSLLTSAANSLQVFLPGIGTFTVSPSLLMGLDVSFGGEHVLATWSHALLYVPSLVPFVLVSFLFAFIWPAASFESFVKCINSTLTGLFKPALALVGALVLVKVMMSGTPDVPSMISRLGQGFAGTLGEYWTAFAVYVGVLGSFFSGSATVSNLTFGSLQYALGSEISATRSVLALQASGAALGNMVCLHNIIAVTTILGLKNQDGIILRRNFAILLVLSLVVTFGTFLVTALT